MLKVFLDNSVAGEFSSVKRVICSGEALPYELQQLFFSLHQAELHNLYGPTEAVTAGFMDEVVSVEDLTDRCQAVAKGLCEIDFEAHRGSKNKVRAECLAALRDAIEAELQD